MVRQHKGVWSVITFLACALVSVQLYAQDSEKILDKQTSTLGSQANDAGVLSNDAAQDQVQVNSSSADSSQNQIVENQIEIVEQPSYDEFLSSLIDLKLKQIPEFVDQLLTYDDERTLPILGTLLQGELYYLRDTKQLVSAIVNPDKSFSLKPISLKQEQQSGLIPDTATKTQIKKIKTSNKVRKHIRQTIAALNLKHPDWSVRLGAVNEMFGSLKSNDIDVLKQIRLNEAHPKVASQLDKVVALMQLEHPDELIRLNSVKALEGALEPSVRNAFEQAIKSDNSEVVVNAAEKALKSIDAKTQFYGYIERIVFGLSLGSILLLVAAGLAITFGVMGVINMAHGELIMLGAYTTYVVQLMMPNHIEYSLFVAIPAAFVVSGLFGVAIERGCIQFLKGRPLETLLATFGISLILQQLVRTVFSPLNRQVATPEFMSGSLELNPVLSITYNRIYIFVFALIVFVLLQLLMKRTSLGLYVRAVSQNRAMARSVGIRSEWVDAMTFGLGSGIAGLAGVALSQITNVGPNLGQSYIIDSFMVVVFGGVGNLWGTLVGAFAIGSLNKFLEPVTGTVLATIIVLVFIILFIQRKPRGLFPQKGRAAES